MAARGRHSKKEIEQALKYAETSDWTIEQTSSGHRWGVARCGFGCSVSVWSTPRNPGNHAKALRKAVEKCSHPDTTQEEEED